MAEKAHLLGYQSQLPNSTSVGRDYGNLDGRYLLRPEVFSVSFFATSFSFLNLASDRGEPVLHVEELRTT